MPEFFLVYILYFFIAIMFRELLNVKCILRTKCLSRIANIFHTSWSPQWSVSIIYYCIRL